MQDVRFSPSGDHFASVGSDFKIFVYDGKTGDTLGEFTESPHTGSIVSTHDMRCDSLAPSEPFSQMACSWSPDSKSLVTSAADRTVKLCTLVSTIARVWF